mgnify:CR=1 FL=1
MTTQRILCGDVRQQLQSCSAGVVSTCVTSPPYFGLRDYGMPNQIGLEQTPDEYVKELVGVFREVRRVLKDDGTLWLNLGDSYGRGNRVLDPMDAIRDRSGAHSVIINASAYGQGAVFPNKQLIGIPWRVAFALQNDGWYLRQDIIWHKPRVMPESVKDRCTKAHEYLFLLTKSPKYYFDSDAIREEAVYPAGTKAAKGSATRAGIKGVNSRPPEYKINDGYRNKRSVWSINPRPYKGAHFATYPPELVEP